jgi:hypothetical protein
MQGPSDEALAGISSGAAVPAPWKPRPELKRAPNAIEQQVLDAIERGKIEAVPSEILMPLYAQLEPVSIEFMLDTWHGSLFDGKPNPDDKDGWWGKNMVSVDHVEPLLFRRPDGSVYSNEAWGLAKLFEGEVNGLSKTVMLQYNDKPLCDYFRRVTDDTVLGFTPAAVLGVDFFFQLTRDHQTKVER